MKRTEYEKELKFLYKMAHEQQNTTLALDILDRGRSLGIENMDMVDETGTERLSVNAVRGKRCVLVVVSDGTVMKEYEYEQDADIALSLRDGCYKYQNGDENFRLNAK